MMYVLVVFLVKMDFSVHRATSTSETRVPVSAVFVSLCDGDSHAHIVRVWQRSRKTSGTDHSGRSLPQRVNPEGFGNMGILIPPGVEPLGAVDIA